MQCGEQRSSTLELACEGKQMSGDRGSSARETPSDHSEGTVRKRGRGKRWVVVQKHKSCNARVRNRQVGRPGDATPTCARLAPSPRVRCSGWSRHTLRRCWQSAARIVGADWEPESELARRRSFAVARRRSSQRSAPPAGAEGPPLHSASPTSSREYR